MFFAHFNAGVRAVDIRNPFQPKEVGNYIPAATDKTDKRCVRTNAGAERCKGVIFAVGNHLPANIPAEMMENYRRYLLANW